MTAVSGVTCEPPVAVKATVTLGKPRFAESSTTNTGRGDTGIPAVALAGAGVTTAIAAGPVSRGSLDELHPAATSEASVMRSVPKLLLICPQIRKVLNNRREITASAKCHSTCFAHTHQDA